MKNTKNPISLPNVWDLCSIFIKENQNLKYCMTYKTYYLYKNDFWSPISQSQVTKLLIRFLRSKYPDSYKTFNLKNLDNISLLLTEHEDFSMPDAIANANSNGFLLPFVNGVLNTKTLDFLPHKSTNYSTHIIPINYNSEDSIIDTEFAEFLTSLVNNNSNRLKILRACLKMIFTNNLLYQIALYIYGPGGTGKSTFINLLIYLLGKDVTLSTSMSQINSRFGLASIIGKYLLVLNDVSLYRGQEPKNIKNIITQDVMEADVKYKQPIAFTPNSFLLIASNTLWEIKNSTTGLARRMIYFPFDNVPEQKQLELFRILRNNEAVGNLLPHLGGFVNWILTCPQEYIDLLSSGGSNITSMISQESIYVNPLNVFVKDCLIKDPNKQISLGSNKINTSTLFGIYNDWCENNGLYPTSFKSFSILLLDLLKQQSWNINKKRTHLGFVVVGVGFNEDYRLKSANLTTNTIIKNNEAIIETSSDNIQTITNSDFLNK